MKSPHEGSSLNDFLKEEGLLEEATSVAPARNLAWQINQLMQEQGLTKQEMAERMRTSRSQLDRLLNPGNGGVTLDTMYRAARAVNCELHLELV